MEDDVIATPTRKKKVFFQNTRDFRNQQLTDEEIERLFVDMSDDERFAVEWLDLSGNNLQCCRIFSFFPNLKRSHWQSDVLFTA